MSFYIFFVFVPFSFVSFIRSSFTRKSDCCGESIKNCVKYCGVDVILVLCYSRPNKISMATDMMEGITRGGGGEYLLHL